MLFIYAVYFTFGAPYQDFGFKDSRFDDFSTYSEIQKFINQIGEKPHYQMIGGDLIYKYAYGECYKGREATQDDLDGLIMAVGGDCYTCVSQ